MLQTLASHGGSLFCLVLGAFLIGHMAGCAAGKQRLATEQLVISDSVDRTVAKIDFSPLSGRRVYLDTKYMTNSKPLGFVSPDYVISSLRQQMMAYDVRILDKPEEADIIVEARCGVLGNDGHDVAFGIPAGNAAASAATALSGTPMPPILPEISLAKRMDQLGATKVAVFAYDKETKEPIWQSGISTSISTAKDYWVLGIGPIQRGSIYGGTRFAGDPLKPFNPIPSIAFAPRLPNPVAAFQGEAAPSQDHPADEYSVAPAQFEQTQPPPSQPPATQAPATQQPQTVPAPRPIPNDLKWAPIPGR